MYITTINEKDQEEIYGKVWKEKKERENDIIIISKMKRIFKSLFYLESGYNNSPLFFLLPSPPTQQLPCTPFTLLNGWFVFLIFFFTHTHHLVFLLCIYFRADHFVLDNQLECSLIPGRY